jgi:hypothetical protein
MLCECVNCQDPEIGGDCLEGFCALCLDALSFDGPWGTVCDDCEKTLAGEHRIEE